MITEKFQLSPIGKALFTIGSEERKDTAPQLIADDRKAGSLTLI